MNAPIFIPSKGRAGKAKCIETLLAEENENLVILVEPQDVEAYEAAYPKANIEVLPDNDRGIAFVRNHLLQRARTQNIDWFWQLDDDINTMGEVVNGKVVKQNFTYVLERSLALLMKFPTLAIGALEYQQYAWSAKRPYAFNSYCDTCVVVNTKNTARLKYRDGVKEDRDIVLQALSTGLITARTTHFCFGSPKNGSNKGGLHDKYKAGLEIQWSKKMIELWPGVCEMNVKPDGRPDVKINWKLFKGTAPTYK